jgi:RNA polymerase sigma-70 factor (ECF subfamily)
LDEPLGALLAEQMAAARQRWSGVAIDETAFAAELGRRVPADARPRAALAQLNVIDLYLAHGCAHADAQAIARFDAEILGPLPARLRRLDVPGDELVQQLRVRLLVGVDGAPPRIADYAGRGSLAGWAQVAGTRLALNLRRDAPPEERLGVSAVEQLATAADPEAALWKQRHGDDFRRAFAEALGALAAEDRELLRLHLLERLTLSQIGQLFALDKSNVSRRLQRVHVTLLDDTRARLGARLRLDSGEVDSLIHGLRSQLDASIERLLDAAD